MNQLARTSAGVTTGLTSGLTTGLTTGLTSGLAVCLAILLAAPSFARAERPAPAKPKPRPAHDSVADLKAVGSVKVSTAPVDFIEDAKLFYRVAACAGTAPLPKGFDAKIVDAHCAEMAERLTRFRAKYLDPAAAFFAAHRPAGLPTKVVYPFGGGDLVSALLTYPEAREITTMSLEHPGDPTRLRQLSGRELKDSLALFREVIRGLLVNNDSASVNMMKMEKGPIPGQLAFFMTGLAAMGYEPVSLKYFRLEDDGTLHYFTQAEVDAVEDKLAKKKKGSWVNTDYSVAYTNMELGFRKAGDGSAPVIVHRHFAANLANNMFKDSPLNKHLLAKGKIVAMTKAASYLLWNSNFTGVRDFLLANMAYMVSDSTGIPPYHAGKAGFEQITFGSYTGPYLEASEKISEQFAKLWSSQKKKKLGFRYGYPDSEKKYHLMITRPKTTK